MRDFEQFARRMLLQLILQGGKYRFLPLPRQIGLDTTYPAISDLMTLESYLEEVKISLANIQVRRPKDNLPHRKRRALRAKRFNTKQKHRTQKSR